MTCAKQHHRQFNCLSIFSGELLWTKHHPRLVLVQMVVEDGITCLKAPGMDDLTIDPKDLEYEKSREFTSKMQEVDIKLIFCGKVYDEWLSNFLLGKIKLTLVIHSLQYKSESLDKFVFILSNILMTLQENRRV